MHWVLGLLFLAMRAIAEPGYITFPSDIEWQSQNSEHFEILFEKGSERFAERALVASEKAYRLLKPIFPETPDRTFIVLSEFQDSTNGYALTFPYPHMVLFAAPPSSRGQLAALDDWLESLALHEFVHVAHLYPAHGLWRAMRTIFGTWVVPNGLMPSHLHEGMAVFWETRTSRRGRGAGPLFSMYRRKAVETKKWGDSFLPIDQMDGVLSVYPHGVSAYFFGHELYQDLWKRKGAKGFTDLTLSFSSNWPYWINIPFEEVYGKSYRTLWEETYARSAREAQKEIEDIQKEPLSKLSYFTRSRFVKSEIAISPNGKWMVAKDANPRNGEFLTQIDLENRKTVALIPTDFNGAEGLCWGKIGGKDWWLYGAAKTQYQHSTFSLSAYSPQDGETKRIDTPEGALAHIHRVDCAADLSSIVVYKESGGEGSLLELENNPELTLIRIRRAWNLPEGSWVSAIAAPQSEKDALWFSLRRGINTEIYSWKDENAPQKMTGFKGHVMQLKPMEGEGLAAILDIDGRNEVWKIFPQSGRAQKIIAVLGGISGFATHGRHWYVTSYEHGGFDIAEASQVTGKMQPLPAPAAELEAQAKPKLGAATSYSAWSTLYPRTWLPSVFFVNDGVQVGAWIPGFDLAQRHVYDVYGGYDSRGQPFVDTSYTHRFAKASSVGATAYYSPGYLTSEKDFLRRWGGSIFHGFEVPWTPFKGRLSLLYRKLEEVTLVSGTSVIPKQSVGVGLDLKYSFGVKKRPAAIAPSSGTTIAVAHSIFRTEMGSTDNYFVTAANLKQYLTAPWWRDSFFMLEAKAAYTEGTSFLNSYFEGGGEVLFSQARSLYQNRAYLPSSFLGRRIANFTAEHLVPIVRVDRGVGLLPALLKELHCAFVADATTYDSGAQSTFSENFLKVFYASVGFELRSQWTIGYYLPTTLRAGVYHALTPGGESLNFTLGAEASL